MNKWMLLRPVVLEIYSVAKSGSLVVLVLLRYFLNSNVEFGLRALTSFEANQCNLSLTNNQA